jgi:exodeoxyribonuclease-1
MNTAVPDELAEIVRGYDFPVRKLKVNGSPFLCPLWELDHDHLAPSDEDKLTRLAQNIQADEDFIARLTTAAVSSERIYAPSEHVELQIYGKGWSPDEDIALCREFHASPWEQRLEIAMRLLDTRLRRLRPPPRLFRTSRPVAWYRPGQFRRGGV